MLGDLPRKYQGLIMIYLLSHSILCYYIIGLSCTCMLTELGLLSRIIRGFSLDRVGVSECMLQKLDNHLEVYMSC